MQRVFRSVAVLWGLALLVSSVGVLASGGSGGSGGGSGSGGGTGSSVDTIKVSKCYYTSVNGYGQMLVNASSSDSSAHLYLYLPSGVYLGEVQNGGGGRYGGTVFIGPPTDPGFVTITSSSGGRISVPTTPFVQ